MQIVAEMYHACEYLFLDYKCNSIMYIRNITTLISFNLGAFLLISINLVECKEHNRRKCRSTLLHSSFAYEPKTTAIPKQKILS